MKDWLYFHTRGITDWWRAHPQPFHGDPDLQAYIRNSVTALDIRSFCETGTFRGDSLRWMAEQFPNLPCVSVETFGLYYLANRWRLSYLKNIEMHWDESVKFLKVAVHVLAQPTLYWLDAHWREELPLKEELEVLQKAQPKALVLVDDIGEYGISDDLIASYGLEPRPVTDTVTAFFSGGLL